MVVVEALLEALYSPKIEKKIGYTSAVSSRVLMNTASLSLSLFF